MVTKKVREREKDATKPEWLRPGPSTVLNQYKASGFTGSFLTEDDETISHVKQ